MAFTDAVYFERMQQRSYCTLWKDCSAFSVFLRSSYEAYGKEAQLSQLYAIFAGIAVVISRPGLSGLIKCMTVRKRKVPGASMAYILLISSRVFTLLIGLAFPIAAPLTGRLVPVGVARAIYCLGILITFWN